MKLYDTQQQALVPVTLPDTVGIYVCGITPYDAAHLGHIFTFMQYDLLQRRLEDAGHRVRLVRNITDVDDPLFVKAKELGVSYIALAERETTAFQSVMTSLSFRPAYAEPKASDYIEPMAAAVKRLLDAELAYHLDGDLYFDTGRDPAFGSFSGYSPHMQRRLMAMRGGDPDRFGKRAPMDFLLWRGSTVADDPAAWDSVVGRGRPGWHIECSVMSNELLGLPFTIHGGGYDLIFPHHECEAAQARGLGHERVADYWLHVAPLLLYGEKMSKSLGNLVFAKDLLASYSPAVIRLALMCYHYRVGGEWRQEFLTDAGRLSVRLRTTLPRLDGKSLASLTDAVRSALDDNLDTVRVIHLLEATSSPKHSSKSPATQEQITVLSDLLGVYF